MVGMRQSVHYNHVNVHSESTGVTRLPIFNSRFDCGLLPTHAFICFRKMRHQMNSNNKMKMLIVVKNTEHVPHSVGLSRIGHQRDNLFDKKNVNETRSLLKECNSSSDKINGNDRIVVVAKLLSCDFDRMQRSPVHFTHYELFVYSQSVMNAFIYYAGLTIGTQCLASLHNYIEQERHTKDHFRSAPRIPNTIWINYENKTNEFAFDVRRAAGSDKCLRQSCDYHFVYVYLVFDGIQFFNMQKIRQLVRALWMRMKKRRKTREKNE